MPTRTIGAADPDPIDTACTVRGATQFHRALGVVSDQFRHVPPDELPHDLLMIEVLSLFLGDMHFWRKEHSGMSHFLQDPQHKLGRHAPAAARFCRAIGATRTAELFDRTLALFPGGELPATYEALVVALVPSERGKPSPLGAIEREYPDTFKELTGALQRWLRANRSEIESAIAAVTNPAAATVTHAGPTALQKILDAHTPPAGEPDYELLTELDQWVWRTPGRKAIPFGEVPPHARMLVLMETLARALGSGGVYYLADWSLGDEFTELREWAEKIAARTTLACLDEFAALFPRKRVPKDKDARSAALDRREEREARKGTSSVRAIDERYADAVAEELPRRVHDYVRFNRQRFEEESASAAAQPPGSSPDDLLLDERDWIAFNHYMIAFEAPAETRLDELPEEERARAGDVMEVKAGRRFAYYQVTHRHRFWGVKGPVMRAIVGTVPTRLTGDALVAHVAGPTAFVTLVAIDRARDNKKAKLVARDLPVPAEHTTFPRFLFHWGKTRDGRNVWGEWDGGESAVAQHIGPLTPAMQRMPVVHGPDYEMLGQAVADGWTQLEEYASHGERVT
jgi:hypothetical protein